jgi:hypothetical protein
MLADDGERRSGGVAPQSGAPSSIRPRTAAASVSAGEAQGIRLRSPRSNGEKIYVALPDAEAARHGRIRVVDESGDDYLYPEERFIEAELPQATRRAVMQAT